MEPNLGHRALADLEKFVNVVILTQNIDGLHQRAGSTKVLELHGSIIEIKCTVCKFKNKILFKLLIFIGSETLFINYNNFFR